jgi:hypothetical protein
MARLWRVSASLASWQQQRDLRPSRSITKTLWSSVCQPSPRSKRAALRLAKPTVFPRGILQPIDGFLGSQRF